MQKDLTLYSNVTYVLPVPDALPSRRLCVRGEDVQQHAMHSYWSPEQRVPANRPLRAIQEITDRVLKGLSRVFVRL